MRDLTQRLSALIVAGLSALTVFAAARYAWAVVSLAAAASPMPSMTLTRVSETSQATWDDSVRPSGAVKAASRWDAGVTVGQTGRPAL